MNDVHSIWQIYEIREMEWGFIWSIDNKLWCKAYIIGTHTFDHGLMVVEIDMTTYEIDTFREKRRTKPLSLNQ